MGGGGVKLILGAKIMAHCQTHARGDQANRYGELLVQGQCFEWSLGVADDSLQNLFCFSKM